MHTDSAKTQSKLSELATVNPFVTSSDLKGAIDVVKRSLEFPEDSSQRQDVLDEVYNHVDQLLVRDFSGLVADNSDDLVLICRNCFEPVDFAVELHSRDGEASFYYLSAESALKFLETALATIDQQIPPCFQAETSLANHLSTDPLYIEIRAEIVQSFKEEVVEMLCAVAGQDLSLDFTSQSGDVFSNKITDALFFAWSCNFKHAKVAVGCVYDYVASGDEILLNHGRKKIN